MFLSEWDRERFSKVSDKELNEEFQEARKYDNSLLISEYTKITRYLWKRDISETMYQVYHDTNPNEETYQAIYQMSGSGSKGLVIAYLHGIINGANAEKKKIKK